MIIDYKRLTIWKKAIEVAKLTYLVTKNFPDTEKFGLTSQMRRSAISIVSNIAEGSQRGSKPEIIRFLYIAKGSTAELEAQNIISHELGFLDDASFRELEALIIAELKMLSVFIKKLKS